MADSRLNLACIPPAEWDTWHAGYTVGYRHGLDAGIQHERDEVSALQAEAVRIVRSLADLPERDAEADAQRAEVRRAWWARRRGEGVA